ncbi:MAG: hypothetical protein GY946_19285 [bacterium]|nr:hypothetical protein [bacterium]
MALRKDYSGRFDPDLSLADFSRQALADLGREYLLNGHLQDRVGLPLVAKHSGGKSYFHCAVEEWMGASPIYTLRMQKVLGFEGRDVGTVFKNLQLDIGAPQQFMDFQFRLDSPEYGEFWLAHCGALMDVEPFGEASVKLMCHDIEDPTFDATAAATHPCMKMRPIHRPPRTPADRHPHCRWKVFIGDEAEPYEQHPNLERVRASKAACLPIEVPGNDGEPGGWPDYSGPFDPDFQLEDLSHRALVGVNREVALQSHLLARSLLLAVSQRLDTAAATELAEAQWTGTAALTAERIREPMGIAGDDIEAVAKVFQIHPCFHPRSYVDFRIEITGSRSARIAIRACPALREADPYSWLAGLDAAPHRALDAIAGSVNSRARCRPVASPDTGTLAWNVEIDPGAEPREMPEELRLAKLSRGAAFRFERRRPLRN